MMRTLEELTIRNFKSIREQTLKLGALNLFIGANGSGKSNLVSVFPLVRRVIQGELRLQTREAGGANRILHFGRKRSASLSISMEFRDADLFKGYGFTLKTTAEDRSVIQDESYWARQFDQTIASTKKGLPPGSPESQIARAPNDIAKHVI